MVDRIIYFTNRISVIQIINDVIVFRFLTEQYMIPLMDEAVDLLDRKDYLRLLEKTL